jgi:hypothetical protein
VGTRRILNALHNPNFDSGAGAFADKAAQPQAAAKNNWLSYFVRVKGFNLREPDEISDVERYDLGDAVGLHHRNQARIVDLSAHDAIGDQERFPRFV